MKVILASKSEQRRKLLDMIGLKYEIITSKAEECSLSTNPKDYVIDLSKTKADSVGKQVKEKAIIIAADTIVYKDNKFYEKPKNKEEAYKNLKELSGKTNYGVTGVTILDLYQNKEICFSDMVEVKFKEIPDDEIRWYVENEENLLSRSGYVVPGKGTLFIEKIDGDYNTLLGLPISLIFEKLYQLGYKIKDFNFEGRE